MSEPVFDLRGGGYAPGDYICTCEACGIRFQGDKRAFKCKRCAAKFANPPAQPEVQINIPLDAHIAATVALQKAWINCNSAEDAALAALAAALEAWPNKRNSYDHSWFDNMKIIILPLEQTK
jgi:hypothetical protein